jgi:hypothetical protein
MANGFSVSDARNAVRTAALWRFCAIDRKCGRSCDTSIGA